MRKTRLARSKARIEVLLQAAARILGQRGGAGLTTNASLGAPGFRRELIALVDSYLSGQP
jgi:hypothetical protein